MSRTSTVVVTLGLMAGLLAPGASATVRDSTASRVTVSTLASFVDRPCVDDICGSGSTVGPDGALYVTDSTGGRIQRIDPRRGTVTTYADGLPLQMEGVIGGGVADIVFLRGTAYVLVNGVSEFWTDLVGSDNEPAAEGIYRLDTVGPGTTKATLVADLYTWSENHPPKNSEWFVPGGYTYSIQTYRGGFLVNDAHHNRVLRVRLSGRIRTFKDFGANVVPTGLDRAGRRILVGMAGPVPHTAATGRVVALGPTTRRVVPLASGAPLLVDVEVGRRGRLYGLAQGNWPYEGEQGKEGFPAAPDTGHLMLANRRGEFRSLVSGLDRPTTMEVIGRTVFVVTITGKVLKISGLGR